jgi:hypothetical protein
MGCTVEMHLISEEKTKSPETAENIVRWFAELNADDVSLVGGKNASLGEMIRMLKHEGIRVPDSAVAVRRLVAEAERRR